MTRLTGAELIAAERQRQITEEDWTPDHDDDHTLDQLARAAASYALPEAWRTLKRRDVRGGMGEQSESYYRFAFAPAGWPWHPDWWKPTPDDRVRELVKAGALIAAEIDRLQRAAVPS